MKLMIDLNIMLDIAQKRMPYYDASAEVINQVLRGKHTACLPAHTITTLHYLVTKFDRSNIANEFIDWMLTHFEIESATKSIFLRARTLNIHDFEDSVVASMAEFARCDYIITRNVSDFKNSVVVAIRPEEFMLLSF